MGLFSEGRHADALWVSVTDTRSLINPHLSVFSEPRSILINIQSCEKHSRPEACNIPIY